MEKIDLDEELYELWKVESLLKIYQDFIKDNFPTDKDFEHNLDHKKLFSVYAIKSERYQPIIDAALCLIDDLHRKIADKVNMQYQVSDK